MSTLTTPLQPSGKMQVTPEQSEILQKELFRMGYVWTYRGRDIKYTKLTYVYWDEYDLGIYSGIRVASFTNSNNDNPLHKFDEHFKNE